MSKLPQISGEKLVKALQRDGWVEVSQRGSHRKLIKPDIRRTIIVPMHKTIKKGTLSSILKDAYVTVEKLRKLL